MITETLNRFKTGRTTAQAPVVPPATETEAEEVRTALASQQEQLVRIAEELARAENTYEERLLDQSLGQKVTQQELTKLRTTVSRLEERRHAAGLAIEALQARDAAWRDKQRERDLVTATAELDALGAKTPAIEAQLVDALRTVAAAYDAYHDHQRAVSKARTEYRRCGGQGGGTGNPRQPFLIPQRFMEGAPRHGESFAGEIERWAEAPAKRKAAHEREIATIVRKQEEQRKREERIARVNKHLADGRPASMLGDADLALVKPGAGFKD